MSVMIKPELTDRLESDYVANIDVLFEFGFVENNSQKPPLFQQIRNSLGDEQFDFLEKRRQAGLLDDTLVIAPHLGKLSLDRFLEQTEHYIARQYTDRDRLTRDPAVHNRHQNESGWSVGMILGDQYDSKGNELEIPGLVFAGRSFYRQQILARLEARRFARQGLEVNPVTIPELVIGKAINPVIRQGTTRLIHLPTPNIFLPAPGKGPGILGVAASLGGHPGAPELQGRNIHIDTSAFHKRDPHAGVRRVLTLR